MSESAAAVIVAAGRSSRMGHDKALLEFDGETALARIRRLLAQAGVARHVVVLNDESSVPTRVDLSSARVVRQPRPERGRTSSIQLGLAALPEEATAFLLCPVDVPLFEAEDVTALLDAWRDRQPGVSVVVPSHRNRRGHPVLFDVALMAEFEALDPDEPARTVLRRREDRVLHVERANPELIADLNTEEDYRAALERRRNR